MVSDSILRQYRNRVQKRVMWAVQMVMVSVGMIWTVLVMVKGSVIPYSVVDVMISSSGLYTSSSSSIGTWFILNLIIITIAASSLFHNHNHNHNHMNISPVPPSPDPPPEQHINQAPPFHDSSTTTQITNHLFQSIWPPDIQQHTLPSPPPDPPNIDHHHYHHQSLASAQTSVDPFHEMFPQHYYSDHHNNEQHSLCQQKTVVARETIPVVDVIDQSHTSTHDDDNEEEEEEEEDTLEATWRAISEEGSKAPGRLLRKSDTWVAPPQVAVKRKSSKEANPADTWRNLRKSETFNDAVSARRRGGLSRDASLGQDELNRRVEAFINKFNHDMRLQRQESDQRFLDMISRGV